jgi:hypothetical protein
MILKRAKLICIALAIILLTATVFVCIIGEKNLKWQEKKIYSGAREVNAVQYRL